MPPTWQICVAEMLTLRHIGACRVRSEVDVHNPSAERTLSASRRRIHRATHAASSTSSAGAACLGLVCAQRLLHPSCKTMRGTVEAWTRRARGWGSRAALPATTTQSLKSLYSSARWDYRFATEFPRHIPYPDPTGQPRHRTSSFSSRPDTMASMTSTIVSTPKMASRSAAPRPARRSATICAAARPEVRAMA